MNQTGEYASRDLTFFRQRDLRKKNSRKPRAEIQVQFCTTERTRPQHELTSRKMLNAPCTSPVFSSRNAVASGIPYFRQICNDIINFGSTFHSATTNVQREHKHSILIFCSLATSKQLDIINTKIPAAMTSSTHHCELKLLSTLQTKRASRPPTSVTGNNLKLLLIFFSEEVKSSCVQFDSCHPFVQCCLR